MEPALLESRNILDILKERYSVPKRLDMTQRLHEVPPPTAWSVADAQLWCLRKRDLFVSAPNIMWRLRAATQAAVDGLLSDTGHLPPRRSSTSSCTR